MDAYDYYAESNHSDGYVCLAMTMPYQFPIIYTIGMTSGMLDMGQPIEEKAVQYQGVCRSFFRELKMVGSSITGVVLNRTLTFDVKALIGVNSGNRQLHECRL